MTTHSRMVAAAAVAVRTAARFVADGHVYARDDPAEQIVNGDFSAGTWWQTGNLFPSLVDGQFCTDVPGATANSWDVIIGQCDLVPESGESYALRFTARASRLVFAASVDWDNATVAFQLGGRSQPFTTTFGFTGASAGATQISEQFLVNGSVCA